jgi:hypothetical protein
MTSISSNQGERPASDLVSSRTMGRRLLYYGLVLVTVPFLWLGVAVALFEIVIGTDGQGASWVVSPFTWALRRDHERPDFRARWKERKPK